VVIVVLLCRSSKPSSSCRRTSRTSGSWPQDGTPRTAAGSTAGFHALFQPLVQRFYRPCLDLTLRARYVTIAAAALALLMIVGSYQHERHMGMILMPEVSADEIEAGVRLPVGTTPDQAAAVAKP
jgi:multidrug efflux pump subunit AcrB